MHGLTHRWIEPKLNASPSALGIGWPPVVERLLLARGWADREAALQFCHPRLKDGLHPPSLMPDLDRAAERLLDAARARDHVVIYGDYDVDGICATAILFHVLRAIAPDARLSTYVPHRIDEGYGLSCEAIEHLANDGAAVIVSVDCGATANEPAARARARGIDLIITDHHNLASPLPEAYALVHPARDDAYPYPHLCGAGVAFKLAWRLATMHQGSERVSSEMRETLLDMLALAGLATIADVVPLTGENRIIARFGLSRTKHTRLTGLDALLKAAGLDGQRIGSEEAGFTLGPRLNAIGRLGHAKAAVELFTTAAPDRAAEIASELNALNRARQETERRIFDVAAERAEAAGMTGDGSRGIVLADEDWHPGVVGIVCSRLIGRFHRPAILMQREEGRCRGSGRSIDGFNLHAALVACAEHLDTFGGHDMAAGLALEASKLDAFMAAFLDHCNERIGPELLVPPLTIDCEATLDELNLDAVRHLERLGPFGRDNPEPTFLLRDVRATSDAEPMGAQAKHMCVRVQQGTRQSRMIAWRWGEHREQIRAGAVFDVAVRAKLNEWNGCVSVQPQIRDVRLS